jgi:hypothetical protein
VCELGEDSSCGRQMSYTRRGNKSSHVEFDGKSNSTSGNKGGRNTYSGDRGQSKGFAGFGAQFAEQVEKNKRNDAQDSEFGYERYTGMYAGD